LVWRFPASFQVQSAPLSERELELIRQGGAETAERFTFHWQDAAEPSNAAQPVSGTVMLVTSRTWRGQHRPERCFTVFGLTIDQSSTQLVEPDFPLRFLSLSGSGAGGRASAAYWLQSASKTTEDFGQRVWADMALQRERWVLVTVLLDREYGSQSPEIYRMFAELRGSVHRSFVEGGVP
jgi:exosortase O